jgi:cytochrome c oxidase subunit 1
MSAVPTDMYGHRIENPEPNYIWAGKGIASWLFTLDHKRIGLLYMVTVLASFALGGFFAIALRTELIAAGPTLPALVTLPVTDDAGQVVAGPDGDPQTRTTVVFPHGKPLDELPGRTIDNVWDNYNQMFTLHGAVMVFLFIIPAIPAILGNFALPLMLGAKDVAFPRLNLMSWYCYMGGGAFFLWVLVSGGLDTGWTFYTPYSTTTDTAVTAAVLGAFILGFSSILTGVNFIATIHMLRAPGQGWLKLPLFVWALYATAVIQILATPVLAITLLLLAAERTLGIGIFDPRMGGDPVLFQHFFWFYSHPAVYIMILPAFGVVSEIIGVHSRKHIFGYGFIAASSIAIALLGFLVWGHHMFTSGQSAMASAVFSLITFSIAIPSAIKVFNWLATMYRGSIRLDTPMLYGIGFIWLFTIGGLTGIFCGTLSVDLHIHDTYFIVAHFHYVMVGSTLFAFLGGMYHWFPKMFGRMYDELWGKISAIVVFIGFNLTFFIQFIAGSQGMPRRYADFPPEFAWYHQISTIGSYVLAIGLVMILVNWIQGMRKGKPAPANPWGANSLEWFTPSPPPHHNFDTTPMGTDPYHYDDWQYDEQLDGYVYRPAQAVPEKEPAHATH